MVRPIKNFISIINSFLHHAVRASGEVQFAREATRVARISQEAADEFLRGRHRLPVLPATRRARVSPREKRSAARCANGALAKRICKCHAFGHQRIKLRRANVRIAQRANRVRPLLIRANPEYVRLLRHAR